MVLWNYDFELRLVTLYAYGNISGFQCLKISPARAFESILQQRYKGPMVFQESPANSSDLYNNGAGMVYSACKFVLMLFMFVCLGCGFMSQSTILVMPGRSVRRSTTRPPYVVNVILWPNLKM